MTRHILLELTLLAVCWAAWPGQAADPTLGPDAGRGNLYAYRVRLIIQFSISPSLWESRFAYGLDHCSGDEVQMLRLLLWIRLPEPASRKEILTEWLSEKGSALNRDEIRRDLEKLVQGHSPEDVSARWNEIEEILPTLTEETRIRQEMKTEVRNRSQVAFAGPTGCKPLDDLAKWFRSDEFLGSELFYANVGRRRRIYERLPHPQPYEGGDHASRGLYALLYVFEPDPAVRTEILLRRIEESAWRHEAGLDEDFWVKKLEPLLAPFSEEEKTRRRAEIRAMKPPVMTPEELKEFRRSMEEMDERMRRIKEEYEARKTRQEDRPSTPTTP